VSIPFSRSMRSLYADDFRLSLLGILLAVILLLAWAAWFFLARITFYETGQIVSVNRDGTVIADFGPGALGRIQSGQSASLKFNDVSGDLAQAIPSIVTDVASQVQEERVQVELYILGEAIALISSQDNLTGQVEVKVERISPATLVMRASGLSIDSPSLSTSPQGPAD
jgi:hypothetical protein